MARTIKEIATTIKEAIMFLRCSEPLRLPATTVLMISSARKHRAVIINIVATEQLPLRTCFYGI